MSALASAINRWAEGLVAYLESLRTPQADLSDEDQQTAEEHARVIAEWVGKHKHPPACNGGCQCSTPDGAA